MPAAAVVGTVLGAEVVFEVVAEDMPVSSTVAAAEPGAGVVAAEGIPDAGAEEGEEAPVAGAVAVAVAAVVVVVHRNTFSFFSFLFVLFTFCFSLFSFSVVKR